MSRYPISPARGIASTKVSIIIPNFNGKELLQKNLPSVINAVKFYDKSGEIIVVDDGSNDGSVEYIREKFPKVKVIPLKKNHGFSFSCNIGAKESNDDVILFLNNDVEVKDNFIEPLIETINQKGVFAVTPRIIMNKKGKMINQGLVSAEFKRGFIRGGFANLKKIGIQDDLKGTTSTLYACAAAVVYDKNKFLELGGFDEIYTPFFFEDVDISYRAWKRGWKVLHEPKSVVIHQGDQTVNKFKKRRRKFIYLRNRLIFHWKNITDEKLIRLHLFFLSLRLLFSALTVDILYLSSFFEALKFLNIIRLQRKIEKKNAKLADQEILSLNDN